MAGRRLAPSEYTTIPRRANWSTLASTYSATRKKKGAEMNGLLNLLGCPSIAYLDLGAVATKIVKDERGSGCSLRPHAPSHADEAAGFIVRAIREAFKLCTELWKGDRHLGTHPFVSCSHQHVVGFYL